MAKKRSSNKGGRRGKRGGAANAGAPRRFVFNEQKKFDVPPSCKSDDPEVNRLNNSLAVYYGTMATCRENVHALLVEELQDSNVGLKQAEARYEGMKVTAHRMMAQITDRQGKPVPFPSHFNHAVKL
ncbi:hypothetical protein CFC21_108341 [Triticum aestivum]|nr:uncharacterized protein LOC109759820 [Aegilops tauschii subsp. strangulata]XP_044439983.1 uncharacterized protein LOC123166274 [Triticum aestivum]KAF7107755.1 hypothetical protein CFC21_108341 [Triticum aestivum]